MTSFHLAHDFQASIRSSVIDSATWLKNEGCATTSSAIACSVTSAPSRNARQCRPGLVAMKSSRVIRLYISRMSRHFTLSQWAAAISVSRSKTCCACCNRIGDAGQLEGGRDVLPVLITNRRVLVEAVVGLVRQSDATLADEDHVPGRVTGVGLGLEVDQARNGLPGEAAEHGHEVLRSGDRIDPGQQGLQRFRTKGLDGGLIHETRVQVSDLRSLAAGIAGLDPGDDLAYGFLRAIPKFDERAGGRLVVGDLGVVQPDAVHVPEKVVLDPYVRVERGEVEDGLRGSRFSHPTMLQRAASTQVWSDCALPRGRNGAPTLSLTPPREARSALGRGPRGPSSAWPAERSPRPRC